MKRITKPEAEVIRFDSTDIVTASREIETQEKDAG